MSRVVPLSQAEFAKAIRGDKPVLVDFYADWCGPCRAVAPIIKQLASDYAGRVVVAKVDVDTQRELAAEQRVVALPTIAVYRNGQLVERLQGSRPKQTLARVLDEALLGGEREAVEVG